MHDNRNPNEQRDCAARKAIPRVQIFSRKVFRLMRFAVSVEVTFVRDVADLNSVQLRFRLPAARDRCRLLARLSGANHSSRPDVPGAARGSRRDRQVALLLQLLLDLARVIFEEQSNVATLIHKIMMHTQSLLQCERCQVILIEEVTPTGQYISCHPDTRHVRYRQIREIFA